MDDLHQRIARSFEAQGLMTTLGARLEHVEPGEVRIALPASPHIAQQRGYAHAGAISSILDTACGYAAYTKVPEGADVVTAEFKINLMRPAVGTHFVATGRVVNAGRTLTVCTGEVRAFSAEQPQGKVVAVMQATIATLPAPPSA